MHPCRPCAQACLVLRDENDDRIRVRYDCARCGTWYGCFAKRLDTEGREAWGPPGAWHFRRTIDVRDAGARCAA